MILKTDDNKRIVDVGSGDLWYCLYSTVKVRLKTLEPSILDAIVFLETGICSVEKTNVTARQLNLIRDGLSACPLSELVYDIRHPDRKAPWEGNISYVITSCGNFFTTADGKDLIFELTAMLCYASVSGVGIICCD